MSSGCLVFFFCFCVTTKLLAPNIGWKCLHARVWNQDEPVRDSNNFLGLLHWSSKPVLSSVSFSKPERTYRILYQSWEQNPPKTLAVGISACFFTWQRAGEYAALPGAVAVLSPTDKAWWGPEIVGFQHLRGIITLMVTKIGKTGKLIKLEHILFVFRCFQGLRLVGLVEFENWFLANWRLTLPSAALSALQSATLAFGHRPWSVPPAFW